MNSSGNHILQQFQRRWKLFSALELVFYALGLGALVYIASSNIVWGIMCFAVLLVFLWVFIRPWNVSLQKVSGFIDQHLEEAQYSSGLLLVKQEELSGLASLQKYKVAQEIKEKIKSITPPHGLSKSIMIFGLSVVIGLLLKNIDAIRYLQQITTNQQKQQIVFKPSDSSAVTSMTPKIVESKVTILYPKYTRKKIEETTEMNIKVVEGSQIVWKLKFEGAINQVVMESLKNVYPMELLNGVYTKTIPVTSSGFYNFKFIDIQGNSFSSDLYAIEVVKDQKPKINIQKLDQFTTFLYNDKKMLPLAAEIIDDYGLEDAYIIATVSKGSGESVKFREEKLRFENKVIKYRKKQIATKNIDLDQFNMEPGDELYFYIEATDQKRPKFNLARSETYFAVIKDTVTDTFAVEGAMGVDLMPDYFRSQRQLIIDTEKLIREESKLEEKDFKFKSNELGFDQKALRVKYGQFMGDESEFGSNAVSNDSDHAEEQHSDQEAEDPLAGYSHKHDTDNEHNLVDHDHATDKKDDDKADPLEAYLHNHEDPEESTLFAKSLKSKLRQALNEMWDAELYLRLYTPKKSLPYQYKALKLLQDIKNSARIYVHRIGFDPPPIKENTRLSGKIDDVKSFKKTVQVADKEQYPTIKKIIERLAILSKEEQLISEDDKTLFQLAGDELAGIAVNNPGKYLGTLQQIKKLSQGKKIEDDRIQEIQQDLLEIVPIINPAINKEPFSRSVLQELLLNELEEL